MLWTQYTAKMSVIEPVSEPSMMSIDTSVLKRASTMARSVLARVPPSLTKRPKRSRLSLVSAVLSGGGEAARPKRLRVGARHADALFVRRGGQFQRSGRFAGQHHACARRNRYARPGIREPCAPFGRARGRDAVAAAEKLPQCSCAGGVSYHKTRLQRRNSLPFFHA